MAEEGIGSMMGENKRIGRAIRGHAKTVRVLATGPPGSIIDR